MLARNPDITHLVDGDQRMIELPVLRHTHDSVTVATPPTGSVAPPGPYMLFVDTSRAQGLEPSQATQVFVEAPGMRSPLGMAGSSASHSATATAAQAAAPSAAMPAAAVAPPAPMAIAPSLVAGPAPVHPAPSPARDLTEIAAIGGLALVLTAAAALTRRRLRSRRAPT